MKTIEQISEIYEIIKFKEYKKLAAIALESINKRPKSNEFRFRKMEGPTPYYDCLALKESCSKSRIPSLSGSEGFIYLTSTGRAGIKTVFNSIKSNPPKDIRINRSASHEDLFQVFVSNN